MEAFFRGFEKRAGDVISMIGRKAKSVSKLDPAKHKPGKVITDKMVPRIRQKHSQETIRKAFKEGKGSGLDTQAINSFYHNQKPKPIKKVKKSKTIQGKYDPSTATKAKGVKKGMTPAAIKARKSDRAYSKVLHEDDYAKTVRYPDGSVGQIRKARPTRGV